MSHRKFRLGKATSRLAYLALPITILCLDFLLYPTLFEGYQDSTNIDISRLIIKKDLLLGNFRAHSIRVSLDEDIQDPDYLAHLKNDNNALVASVFVGDDGDVSTGGLVNALLNTLQNSYPKDAQLIRDLIAEPNEIRLGHISYIELHASIQRPANFPIRYLILVPLPYGDPNENKRQLPDALSHALELAEDKNIANVVVPCLGTNWDNKNSVGFDDFFSAFFNAVPNGKSSPNIYLSFYNEWPSFYLEAAVSSLNASWQRSFAAAYKDFPALYQREFRLIAVFLGLCLLVTSFSIRLTVRKWFIVSAAFVGLTTGLERAFIDRFRQFLSPFWALTIEIVLLALSAILFRFISISSAKDVFE